MHKVEKEDIKEITAEELLVEIAKENEVVHDRKYQDEGDNLDVIEDTEVKEEGE